MTGRPFHPERLAWLRLDDEALLALCDFTWYQASGPGGQKRNRKYSAARVSHPPTKLSATCVETRDQNKNKSLALRKLRLELAVEIAGPPVEFEFDEAPGIHSAPYPLWLAKVFDALWAAELRPADAADALGLSSSKLLKLLCRDTFAWRKLNEQRQATGLPPLRAN